MAKKNISELISIISFALLAAFFAFFIKIVGNNFDFFSTQRFNDIISLDYQKQANFENFLQKINSKSKSGDFVCFIAAGDLMPSRGVGQKMRQKGCEYIFGKIKNYFDSADFSIANLESPISNCPELAPDTMEFCAGKETIDCLKENKDDFGLGLDIALLANNHMMNFNAKGLQDTIGILDSSQIFYTGAGKNLDQANKPVFIEKKGIKFGILAYTDRDVLDVNYAAKDNSYGVNPMDYNLLENGVLLAKKDSDFVIVFMHSGDEYVENANKRQIEFAHRAIDLGADLVIGSHPHVVQNAEIYNGKYIFYSLGNFSFDQMWSQDTRNGLITKFCFDKKGLQNIELIPTQIKDYSQPNFILGAVGNSILNRLKIDAKDTDALFYENDYKIEKIKHLGSFSLKNMDKTVYDIKINEKETLDYCRLQDGILEIFLNGALIYKSDSRWRVDDFKFADIDNDNNLELNISVWKSGNFGNSKPFWEKDDPSVKNHFFVFKIINRKIQPFWQSSNLEKPNCEFDFADLNSDNKKELIAIEGEYNESFDCIGKDYAVWQWNGWGFEKNYQSQDGNYSNLRVFSLNNMPYAFIDKY